MGACDQTHTRLCLVLQLLDDIVPTLVARAEALEKRARAAAKIAAQLNNVVPDDNGHYGRSRRQRTQVSMPDGANTVLLHTHIRIQVNDKFTHNMEITWIYEYNMDI